MNKHAMSDACISSATSSSTSHQSTLDGDLVNKTIIQGKSLKLTQVIVKWISKDCWPINIAEDKKLFKILRIALDNRSYDVPCRKTISHKLGNMLDGKFQ